MGIRNETLKGSIEVSQNGAYVANGTVAVVSYIISDMFLGPLPAAVNKLTSGSLAFASAWQSTVQPGTYSTVIYNAYINQQPVQISIDTQPNGKKTKSKFIY